ncbi:hypothetical protein PENSUB_4169, partial [Penicillium subrubescens]
ILQALFYNTWIIELNCGFTADCSLLLTFCVEAAVKTIDCVSWVKTYNATEGRKKTVVN